MATWAARVEFTLDHDLTGEEAIAITEALAEVDPAASVGVEREQGRASAQFFVTARTLRSATEQAVGRTVVALGLAGLAAEPVGVEVLDEATFAERLTRPTIPELVGYAEIAEIAGVSRQRVAQLADEHEDFPPVVLTAKPGPQRVKAAVEQWFTAKGERRRGRPPKPAAS